MNTNVFGGVQRLGRALMLPIAIMPVAGLMLRLGAGDVFDLPFMFQAGAAIFDNLPLLFAIGVAVGWAKENNGAAGLAGAVGYFVLTFCSLAFASTLLGSKIDDLFLVINKRPDELLIALQDLGVTVSDPAVFTSAIAAGTFDVARKALTLPTSAKALGVDMGVLAGIFSGLLAGTLYNRYFDIKLPTFLAFFGGRRFVPIVTGFSALFLGLAFAWAWPIVGEYLKMAGQWAVDAGPSGKFIYGFLNRILLVTGLHHIVNSLVWFDFGEFIKPDGSVIRGDLWRFFAGDASAGGFMTGFFPVMMFGLPGAALAMFVTARKEKRAVAGGVLLSLALTSFLTGVTEPMEFGFMFLAPFLYVIHALLTGLSLFLMDLVGAKSGFTFSAGALDFIINYKAATRPMLVLGLGVIYFFVYFSIFYFVIRKFNLPTIGRERVEVEENKGTLDAMGTEQSSLAAKYITALGGSENLTDVDSCATRLRLSVKDSQKVNEAMIKHLGARGLLKPSTTAVQVIIGPEVELLANDIKEIVVSGVTIVGVQQGAPVARQVKSEQLIASADIQAQAEECCALLGGRDNINLVEVAAETRVLVTLKNAQELDKNTLKQAGISGTMALSDGRIMLIAGTKAPELTQALQTLLA